MALRTKTIEYAFALNTPSVATAVARTFTNITVNIPETTTRTFRSVQVIYSCIDNVGTAASMTAVNLSCTVGAAAASAATVTQTIANSGENQAFYFIKDVTAYFQTNFTGASQTVGAAMTVTGVATQNASAKLIITYEFEDSAQTTRIKTVKIPVDGNTTALTTAFVNVGGLAGQIPALDTFLPEDTKVYRSIFFEMMTHTGTTAAAASTLDLSYNGGTTTVADLSWGHTLITDTFYHRIDNLTGVLTTSAAQNLQAKCTSTTGEPTPCLSGVLVVTYEYDHSASTRTINSIQVPVMDEAAFSGGNTTADRSRFQRTITVQEPGTITLLQSGVLMSFNSSGATTVDLRVGGQASRTYAHAATVRGGSCIHMRRFDSGAVGGAGMTLARGTNTLTIDWFTSAITAGTSASNVSGLCYLNYSSDIHTDGDMVHNHTTQWVTRAHATGNLVPILQVTPLTTPIIQATNYWLTGAGFQIVHMTSGTANTSLSVGVLGEVQSTEAEGAGWRSMYTGMMESDSECSPNIMYARVRDDFKRWSNDPDTTRLNIETSRSFRFDSSVATGSFWQMSQFISYHAITYSISGTISNSGGGTVTLTAYRVSDGLEIGTTTRVGNGSYTIPWHDNVDPVIVEAYEDATHKGLSVSQVSDNVNTFNIDLNPSTGGGGGGPTYYAYG